MRVLVPLALDCLVLDLDTGLHAEMFGPINEARSRLFSAGAREMGAMVAWRTRVMSRKGGSRRETTKAGRKVVPQRGPRVRRRGPYRCDSRNAWRGRRIVCISRFSAF
jgi:hypothetical protein